MPFFVSVQFTSLPHKFCWWCRAKSKYLKCSLLVCREVAWRNWKYMYLMMYLKHSSFFAILLSLDLWWIIWVLWYRTVHCIINTWAKPQTLNVGKHICDFKPWNFSSFQYLIQWNWMYRYVFWLKRETTLHAYFCPLVKWKKHCLPKNKNLHSLKK